MPEHIQYQDDDLFNPETHHEDSDVPIRPLFKAVVIFVVFAAVTHGVLYWMYAMFVKAERKRMDPPQTQVARPVDADVPKNQPLLQPFPRADLAPNRDTPVTDLTNVRTAEQRALDHYQWVDREKGIVRIPIEAAKELALQRGFPIGTAPPPPPPPPPATTTGGTP